MAPFLDLRRMCPLWACLGLCLAAGEAHAWGATGHRLIGREAVSALPAELPAFLHRTIAVDLVGELAREPDRWKDSGRQHDSDRDPAHFLNLGDDGVILGGLRADTLPQTRIGYEAALGAAHADSWKAGYLPYAIIDAEQQLTKDFAYWRVDRTAADRVANGEHRGWFETDRMEREALILRDLGVLAHYVGDASQPLHVTQHFNGWGPGPNPEGFTQQRIHAAFEGEFVRLNVDAAAVRAAMTPFVDCGCDIVSWTRDELIATNREVAAFYRLQKAKAFVLGDSRGKTFAAARLAAGASALRDAVIYAWRTSATSRVGWPAVAVADVEAGGFDPYDSLYGAD